MRWVKRIVIGLIVLVALAVGALFVIPTDRIARLAADQFETATGRVLSISGDVRPTIFPRLGVRIEGVSIANAAWSDQGPMLRAESLSVGINAAAIFGGAVEVEELTINSPVIVLERAADGATNWTFGEQGAPATAPAQTSDATPAPASGGTPAVSLAMGRIEGGSLTYLDHGAGVQHRLDAVDMEVAFPSLRERAMVTGSGLYNGAQVAFSVAADNVEGLMEGVVSPVEVSVEIGGTEAALSGRAALEPLSFEGTLHATSTERATLFAALGQSAPALPTGLGRERVVLNTQVTLASAGSVHLREMVLELDGNSLRGEVDVTLDGPRPKIVANLQSPGLDLAAATGGGGASAPASGSGGSGWSTAPIDVSGLGAVDAEVALVTGPVTLDTGRLDAVSASVSVENARAVLSLNPVRAYGGTITGNVVVNGRGGLSTRIDLVLAGLQAQPFLSDFAEYDRLVGQADFAINVLGSGASMDAVMRSLDGEGRLSLGKGEILGFDLMGMIRNFDTSFRGDGARTIFDGITGTFVVNDGVLSNSDLAFVAPLARATGEGTVNIGAQTLNYRVVPTVLGNGSDGGLSVPVLITGPWASPSFRPDLEFLAKQRLDVEAEAMEDRARQALDDKIADELDVAPTEGQSVEDAVKDKLEDELKGALGGLFGRN